MSSDSSTAAAGSQFTAVTNQTEFQLHLPFESEEPVQPYCEAEVRWPLTVADLQRFEAESKAGNVHATNNLGSFRSAPVVCRI